MPGPIITTPSTLSKADMAMATKPRQANDLQNRQLKQACEDFESLFVNMVMQQMRQTVPKDGLLNGGQAEQLYTSMLDSEMAKSISHQRGLGLASAIYRQLISLKTDGKEENR